MQIAQQYIGRLETAKFRHPPPVFENVRIFKLQHVKPPLDDAPGWQCSVYYYWYEYLRRHTGYHETCKKDGNGSYAEQFAVFGDVHELSFADWWGQHFMLFAEPEPAFLVHKRQLEKGESVQRSNFIEYVQIDLRYSETDIVRRVRDLVRVSKSRTGYRYEKHLERTGGDVELARQFKKRRRVISHAQYKVTSRPSLPALHQHLAVWDAKQDYPNADDAELFDTSSVTAQLPYSEAEIASLKAEGLKVADLEKANRRSKRLAVQRHLRIAQQYIDNVVWGEFPKRDKR
jgi:hypothetical protein